MTNELLFNEVKIILNKNIPQAVFNNVVGTTMVKNKAPNVAGRPTINIAEVRKVVPLIRVPIGRTIHIKRLFCFIDFRLFIDLILISKVNKI